MNNNVSEDSIYERPLIKLMMSVSAARLTHRQFNVLSLIIVHTFDSDKTITPKFISLKAFESHTRYKPEVIQSILAFLIEHRIVSRTYPDETGLPFYAINTDSDTWTVWPDSPAQPQQPQEGNPVDG